MEELRTLYNAARWYRRHPERQYLGQQVRDYDNAASLLTDRQDFAHSLVEQIGSNPGRVLEIAAGTGLVSQVLHENYRDLYYSDLSLPALQMLRERVGYQAHIAQADFFHLPFLSDSFDTMVCVGGYRYVPPDAKQDFWDEAKRLLRTNGHFFISQFYPRGRSIQGNDINIDRYLINRAFNVVNASEYEAKVDLPLFSVRSGTYRTFEFLLEK